MFFFKETRYSSQLLDFLLVLLFNLFQYDDLIKTSICLIIMKDTLYLRLTFNLRIIKTCVLYKVLNINSPFQVVIVRCI